jgi:hypothetical protein
VASEGSFCGSETAFPASGANYKLVSHRWLQGYLNEFCWRYSHRHVRRAMFHTLVERAAEPHSSA